MRPAVRRPFLLSLLVAALAAGSACKNDSTSDSGTTNPTPITVTDTFTGELHTNGAQSFSFTVQNAGTVTVTLTDISDTVDSNLPAPNVGISLGSWDGAACSVQTGVFTDNASVNASIAGSVQGAGVLCARIYDPASYVTNPLAFTLTVVHP